MFGAILITLGVLLTLAHSFRRVTFTRVGLAQGPVSPAPTSPARGGPSAFATTSSNLSRLVLAALSAMGSALSSTLAWATKPASKPLTVAPPPEG